MVRKHRTRAVGKLDAAAFLAKAEQFQATMDSALAAGQWDSTGLQAVHAVISVADALITYYGGMRSADQDHRAAAGLLQEVLGPDATAASRHISRVIAKKNTVEYEQRRLTEMEARDMADHTRRLFALQSSDYRRTSGIDNSHGTIDLAVSSNSEYSLAR